MIAASPHPNTSVLIVSFRTPELTAAAVRSALDAGAGDVVVVDNASGDDSPAAVRAIKDPRVRLFESEWNTGFGAAANRAACEARGDVLVFLNGDAQLERAALAQLEREVRIYRGKCLAAPRLVGTDGSTQRSAGLLPTPVDLVVRALGLHLPGRWIRRMAAIGRIVARLPLVRQYESAVTATSPIDTDMIAGACFATGRHEFLAVGGFDERFFMYFEDADLCRRAASSGWSIRFLPSAIVRHVGGASSSEDYHFGPLHARAMRQYLRKWYGRAGSALAILLLWLRALAFTVTLRPAARRGWSALLAAVRDEDPRR